MTWQLMQTSGSSLKYDAAREMCTTRTASPASTPPMVKTASRQPG
jgi:hypothetical protein